jgi:hypothetical protein
MATALLVLLLACSLSGAVFNGQPLSRTSHLVHMDACTASVLNSRYIVRAFPARVWGFFFLTVASSRLPTACSPSKRAAASRWTLWRST